MDEIILTPDVDDWDTLAYAIKKFGNVSFIYDYNGEEQLHLFICNSHVDMNGVVSPELMLGVWQGGFELFDMDNGTYTAVNEIWDNLDINDKEKTALVQLITALKSRL